MNENKLDQFYTNDSISRLCFDYLKTVIDINNVFFLEPSAGGGSFIRAIEGTKFFACDIAPSAEGIEKLDFLNSDISGVLPKNKKIIVLGNPPFGKRSSLALKFIEKAFSYSSIVCFVLPIQFRKYLTQKQIREDANLLLDKDLPKDSFLYDGKPYDVRCCFQIWTLEKIPNDLRIRKKQETNHPDFEMWQYNNTKQAEKYFNREIYDWDFAVIRQGYNDYSKRFFPSDTFDLKKQYIFFKAKDDTILERLLSLDYNDLSLMNTSTPGFGKADVIKKYDSIYGKSHLLSIDDFFLN